MNTRIQVGASCNRAGFRHRSDQRADPCCCRRAISVSQEDIQIKGHAIECRINAENPKKHFMPCPAALPMCIFLVEMVSAWIHTFTMIIKYLLTMTPCL